MYIAANNADRDDRRTYTAEWDEKEGDVLILAYDGHQPNISEEVVFEEHFTEGEAVDLMRSIRDAIRDSRKRVDASNTVTEAVDAAAKPYPHSDDV